MDSVQRLSGIVDAIIRGMVDDESAVKLTVIPEQYRVNLRLTVAPGDYGKVVGKKGHNIQSIRYIVDAIGKRFKLPSCEVVVDDPRKNMVDKKQYYNYTRMHLDNDTN